MFGRRYFGARHFGPRYFGDGGSGIPPEPPAVSDEVAGGFWLRPLHKIEEPEDALRVIEIHGTEAQQERAEDIRPLLYKLEHAKGLLDAEQKRRARAESRWALAIANQIRQERDDEEIAAALLLLH